MKFVLEYTESEPEFVKDEQSQTLTGIATAIKISQAIWGKRKRKGEATLNIYTDEKIIAVACKNIVSLTIVGA